MKTIPGLLCLLLVLGELEASGDDRGALKSIKGISQKKLERLRRLTRRYHQQQRNLMSLPDSAKLIKLPDQLEKFCNTADLVAITFSKDAALAQAAFNLLQQPPANNKLSQADARRLLQHLVARDPKAPWKALWASGVLGPNQKHGVPALAGLLTSSDAFVLVHAAGGLGKQKGKISARIWRRAAEVLLKALGNADDTAREAHNYMPAFEPWMRQWLITRLLKAKRDSPLWLHGLSVLSFRAKGPDKRLRAVFLKALKNPRVQTRISAVVGLRDRGLTRADLKIYRQIARDKDRNVRGSLFAGLSQAKARWAAPLLMTGLGDPALDNVAESAQSLMVLGYPPAVPRLVAFLRKNLKARPLHNAFRIAAEAVVKLAKLTAYDFKPKYDVRGNRHMHATVIVNRDDHYRREARRLFKWWSTRGRKMRWRGR